jgi:hypothetical protein
MMHIGTQRRRNLCPKKSNLLSYLSGALAPMLVGAALLYTGEITYAAPCTGPGAPSNTQTQCLTAIALPTPLTSFDISFINPDRGEYYLGDRSAKGVDVIDTSRLTFMRVVGSDKPFTGVVLNAAGTGVNNAASGPAGVASHGRWLYVGDGNSTLHVIDLDSPDASATKQVIPTGGKGLSGLFNERDDNRAHGRDERRSVQAFYEGQTFMYEIVKLLAKGAE